MKLAEQVKGLYEDRNSECGVFCRQQPGFFNKSKTGDEKKKANLLWIKETRDK